MNLVRVIQILRGEDITPKTKLESAVKYALDHSGGSSGGNNDFDFDVTASFSMQTGWSATTTETYANVLAAVNAKKNVAANVNLSGGAFVKLPYILATIHNGTKENLFFSCVANHLDDDEEEGYPGFIQLIFYPPDTLHPNGTLGFEVSDLAFAPEEPEPEEDEGTDGA